MSRLYISTYHYTRDLRHSRYPKIKGLDVALFKQQLDFLEQNFSVVRMEDVMEAADGGKELPDDALLLTFDDGYIDNFTVAFPLLMEHGMQGSFFIPGKTFAENTLLDVNKLHFVLACAPIDRLVADVKDLILGGVRHILSFHHAMSYMQHTQSVTGLMTGILFFARGSYRLRCPRR